MDTSIKPGDDFFLYANGTWLKKNPIPAAYGYWGNFSELHDRNQIILRAILDDLHSLPDASLDADARKLRDFYDTAMDEAKLERDGIAPLAPEFERIQHIASRDDLLATIMHLHEIGAEPLYDASVGVDERHSDRYSLHFWQSGQGLPERDYYLWNVKGFTRHPRQIS